MAQCAAMSKRTKERCRDYAMRGRRVCYKHGGKAPMGYALPQTTHGRYSKLLPLQMAAKYREARDNPDLRSLHDDIAVLEARLTELFARLGQDTAADGETWAEIRRMWDIRCTLTQTEVRRLVALDQMISTEQLMVFLGVVTDVIQRAVMQYTDAASARAILGALSYELTRLGLAEARGDSRRHAPAP
jgi:hypothetical protein